MLNHDLLKLTELLSSHNSLYDLIGLTNAIDSAIANLLVLQMIHATKISTIDVLFDRI